MDVKGREREKGGVRGGAVGDEGGGDGASANVPITPRDASDGRVSGLVLFSFSSFMSLSINSQFTILPIFLNAHSNQKDTWKASLAI